MRWADVTTSSGSASPSMRWADVYVPHVSLDVPLRWRWADVYVSGLGPRDHVSGLGPRDRWLSLSWCPGALSPGARCDGPTSTCPSTSACWPTVLLADGVALRNPLPSAAG